MLQGEYKVAGEARGERPSLFRLVVRADSVNGRAGGTTAGQQPGWAALADGHHLTRANAFGDGRNKRRHMYLPLGSTMISHPSLEQTTNLRDFQNISTRAQILC
jgi:hypothetical protein